MQQSRPCTQSGAFIPMLDSFYCYYVRFVIALIEYDYLLNKPIKKVLHTLYIYNNVPYIYIFINNIPKDLSL